MQAKLLVRPHAPATVLDLHDVDGRRHYHDGGAG